jgi:SAM-dependent methyltransferase
MSTAREAYRDYYDEADNPDFHVPRYQWTIDNFIPGVAGKKILEIGSGDGGCIKLLGDHNEVAGVDASESGVNRCRARGVPATLVDVSTQPLPFEADTFDIVISLETFEHLANPQHAIDEVRRVLKPQGRLICSIPNPRIGHPYLYPGLFTFANFRRFLEQNSFRITRIVPWGWAPRHSLLPTTLQRSGLTRSRYVAGAIRRALRALLRNSRFFPHYLYWLWTFDALYEKLVESPTMLESQARATRPAAPAGSDRHGASISGS